MFFYLFPTTKMNFILTTAYFPPIEYIALIENGSSVFIEGDENFQKQSYRNRMSILTANGVQHLSIPVVQNHTKTKIRDAEIDYKTEWQKQHWRAITSAYNNSPFFLYYQDYFYPFYEKKNRFLLDFNTELLIVLLKLCHIDKEVLFTKEFQAYYETPMLDYRTIIHPKRCNLSDYFFTNQVAYNQVFDGKYGFTPNLSILDLLCNQGNQTKQYLNGFRVK